jgi:alcohol dehydrogenase
MRSIAVDERSRVELVDAEAPEAAEGETLVRVALVALGVSDLTAPGPRGLGRSILGRREDGSRAIVAPDLVCGACDMCRGGLGIHCENRRTFGEPGAPGGLAERLAIPARCLLSVPEHLADEHAVMAAFAGQALQAAGRLHVREKPYATVIGAGAETVLTAAALGLVSATARVLSSSGPTLAACEKRGIRSRPIAEAGRRGDQDVVIVCAGEPGALGAALAMAAPRGRVVLTPGVRPAPEDLHRISERELDVLGSRWAPIREGLAAIADGRLDASGLLEKRVKLDRAVEGIAALARGETLALGVDLA